MIKKQNLRINVLAAAVLSMTAVGAVHAAGLPTREPVRQASAAQPGTDRIIVKYRAGSAAAGDRSAKLSTVQSALTRASLAGGTARASTLGPQVVRRLGVGADVIRLQGRLAPAELQRVLKELKADPAVQYAEADVKLRRSELRAGDVQPALAPNDPYYQQYQWHLHNATGGINAPSAWDVSQGEGVVVAVLDTGILPQHPDLVGNLLEGYDFISDAETSRRATNDRVPGAQDYGDWVENDNECYTGSVAEDSSWHGTHVAGTVAEQTNNGVGMAGVAHKAKVLPVRVLGKCGGYLSDIADAITWASGGTVAGVPANANPAEVINMSLGGSGSCDGTYQDAINGAISRGTTVVVAAGNETDNASKYRPASCDGVVTVGATRITGGITYYSNYGTRVDLSGPGGGRQRRWQSRRLRLAVRFRCGHHAGVGQLQLHGHGWHVDGLAARGCRRGTGAERADRQGQGSAGPRGDAHAAEGNRASVPGQHPDRHSDRHRHRRCQGGAGQGTGRAVHRELRAGGDAADQQDRRGGAERYGRQQPPVQLRGSRRKAAQRDHLRWHRQRVGLHRPGT